MIWVSPRACAECALTEHPDRLLAAADLGAAAGGVEVQRAQLLVDLRRRDAQGLHSRRIQFDPDLRLTPPPRDTCATPGPPAGAC